MVSIEDSMAGVPHSASATVLIAAPRIDLCLDFANTLFWRGSNPEESLHDFAELLEWCVKAAVLSKHEAIEYRPLAKNDPAQASEIFSEAIAMREAIYRIVYSAASGKVPAETDLRTLNEGLKRAPVRGRIEHSGNAFGWRVERTKSAAAAMLAPVLWSAADLLVGPSLARVRHCANDRCLWLFLDESKNSTRRWCSMQSCGNRAKAHRHYLRQTQT
jgi:predicted RNA-binding Zn ribbon-like protein